MIYLRHTENYIIIYDVIFNRFEIEEFKNQVINDCSEIVQRKYCSTCAPSPQNPRIKEFYQEKAFSYDLNNETKTFYNYKYKEYLPPYLVMIIESLLLGSNELIDDIFKINYELERPSIDDRIKKITIELNSINKSDIKL